MPSAAIKALEADRVALLAICAGLTDADWKAESGCAGWSVQDVVAPLGALFWLVVDPSTLPDAGGLPTERAQDVYVEARRSLGPPQILADYETVSAECIERLTGLDSQDFELALQGSERTRHRCARTRTASATPPTSEATRSPPPALSTTK